MLPLLWQPKNLLSNIKRRKAQHFMHTTGKAWVLLSIVLHLRHHKWFRWDDAKNNEDVYDKFKGLVLIDVGETKWKIFTYSLYRFSLDMHTEWSIIHSKSSLKSFVTVLFNIHTRGEVLTAMNGMSPMVQSAHRFALRVHFVILQAVPHMISWTPFIWYIVDAINAHPNLQISYLHDPSEQRLITESFRKKSGAYFDYCTGAVDGILVWVHKPLEDECEKARCSSAGKFFCGSKHKFGLNCQAVCDSRGKFLDVSIIYPGSTSDCLAFEGM